jgi:hypothetical protein
MQGVSFQQILCSCNSSALPGCLDRLDSPILFSIIFPNRAAVVFEESADVAVAHLEGGFPGIVKHGKMVAAKAVAHAVGLPIRPTLLANPIHLSI